MQKVILDLLPGGVAPIVYASQYDDGRSIRFMLTEGGPDSQYSLNASEVITCNLTKPDGTETVIDVANPGAGKTYVDLVNGADDYDQAGVYLGEIVLTKDARVIGSANFVLNVEEDAYGGQITTLTATGNPCTFETDLADALVSLTTDIVASGGNGSPDSPIPLVGHSELNIGNTQTEEIRELFTIDPNFSSRVNFNQLANINTGVSEGATITVDVNGVVEFSGVTTGNPKISHITHISGHKYLCLQKTIANPNNIDFTLGMDSGSPWITNGDIVGDHNSIYTSVYDTDFKLFYANGQDLTGIKLKIQIFDLTQMFGSTIADYIYNLEQSQSGAGVEFFKAIYPQDYYPYNAGQDKIVGDITPVTVAFGQTVYGGVYDKSGRLTITHELVTYTGVNSESWVMLGSGSASAYCMGISKPDCKVYSSLTSNYLESVPYDATWGNYDNFISCVSSTIYTGIRTITTVEDWRTYLSNNPLTVLYELATPIVIDVPSISVFAENGVNNIVSDCGGDVNVTYIKKV